MIRFVRAAWLLPVLFAMSTTPAALAQGAAAKPAQAKVAQAKTAPGKTGAAKSAPAQSAQVKTAQAKTAQAKQPAKKESSTGSATSGALELGKFNDWGAYMAGTGAGKVCFALSQPKERAPAGLARDPAYIFITSRPAQNVRNEVSFTMGFPMKAGVDATATVDGKSFALEAKDHTAFVKNAAEEGRFVDSMREGARLQVKSTSLRGNVTTDSYSLSGLGKALDKLVSDCK